MLILILISHISSVSKFLLSINMDTFNCIPLFSGYNFENIVPILYVFIFVTGLGYACYFKAMEETSANTASLVFFFKPVLSPILAFIFINEFIPVNMIMGILFILIGSIYTILCNIKLENSNLSCISNDN